MGFLMNLLTLPMLDAPVIVHWLARTIAEEVERERLDEGRVRGQLLELQELHEAGDLSDEDYDRLETELLENLKTIREIKERQTRKG